VRNNDHLAQIVHDQEKSRQDLVDRLRQDEVLQKAAVAALLERSDARSWSIIQQMNLVQSQLAALTNIELERRKLEINQQLVSSILSLQEFKKIPFVITTLIIQFVKFLNIIKYNFINAIKHTRTHNFLKLCMYF